MKREKCIYVLKSKIIIINCSNVKYDVELVIFIVLL